MLIVVADIEPVLELMKVGLAADLFRLEHEFCALDLCVDGIWLPSEAALFSGLGLRIEELDGAKVSEAVRIVREHRELAVRDAMAIVLAESRGASILSVNERIAKIERVGCPTVVSMAWIFDALEETVPLQRMLPALKLLVGKGNCGLSDADTRRRISKLDH
ncbi:hypothetical protein CN311_06225 [Mesorhizobium sanjuanii]|uniref:PIN domain-containing protein n=1 Tax=Mesorhizobium sanjuanii TaxID=2037900 RepID=A0A2A6FJV1_9HYPH|nr:PIN domain-containing protein [Mesorhizobium sanjuanii]PDQ22012.1 hypothetical protein CN311_06225 [Mesorhizobium sanjuanii]